MRRRFRERDIVVYEKHKHGTHPTPRARAVRPSSAGDDYSYVVDKYWLVLRVGDDGRLLLRTPGGKLHEIDPDDPLLRPLSWFERLRLRFFEPGRLEALLRTPP
jgi:hypothetical protein